MHVSKPKALRIEATERRAVRDRRDTAREVQAQLAALL